MRNTSTSPSLIAALVLGCGLLGGCSHAPKTLYQWEDYQPEVYEYFKGQEAKEAQVAKLEGDLQKIRATNNTPPPGFHAQLGMLYGSLGNGGAMAEQFNAEKALFPESSTYMDFLLKNARNGVKP